MLETQTILLLGGIFLFTFIFGRIFEKIHIPGIFVALLLGIGGSYLPFVQESIHYDGFKILSFLAMNFLLFLIGFEIDLKKTKKLGSFIVRSSILIILSEALALGILISLIFGLPWIISGLIGLSFATVGEAILIPILDSLKITKTNLGQAILGVATMDDIFEIFSVIIVIAFLPIIINSSSTSFSLLEIFIPLGVLFGIIGLGISMVLFFKKFSSIKQAITKYRFFFSMLSFFVFIGLGALADMSAIGAIVGGLVANNVLHQKDSSLIEGQVKNIAYYLFGPIFFFSIGADVNMQTLGDYFRLIILFSTVPYLIKIFVSYLNGRKKLGAHKSIYMGIALGVRFSTSIVILTLFLQKGIISDKIFSVLISTTIVLKFVIPTLLSFLAKKWHIIGKNSKPVL